MMTIQKSELKSAVPTIPMPPPLHEFERLLEGRKVVAEASTLENKTITKIQKSELNNDVPTIPVLPSLHGFESFFEGLEEIAEVAPAATAQIGRQVSAENVEKDLSPLSNEQADGCAGGDADQRQYP